MAPHSLPPENTAGNWQDISTALINVTRSLQVSVCESLLHESLRGTARTRRLAPSIACTKPSRPHLRLQRRDIDHEAVAHVALQHAFVRFVHLLDGHHFNIR